MRRIIGAELLDELPPEDQRAIHSRRDLSRVNVLMRSHRIMADALRSGANGHTPRDIVDLGAGDGDFLLRVARRLASSWQGVSASLLDRQRIAGTTRLKEFEQVGWRADSLIADVFDWARQASAKPAEFVIANLFLHHFANAQLAELFHAIGNGARLFVAVEPQRSPWPLLWSRSLWALGCNAVTRHDAVASVRAGFSRCELSALWPAGNEWILTEKPAGLFSHLFVARRRG